MTAISNSCRAKATTTDAASSGLASFSGAGLYKRGCRLVWVKKTRESESAELDKRALPDLLRLPSRPARRCGQARTDTTTAIFVVACTAVYHFPSCFVCTKQEAVVPDNVIFYRYVPRFPNLVVSFYRLPRLPPRAWRPSARQTPSRPEIPRYSIPR